MEFKSYGMERYIELPACTLHYKLSGQGPLVLLIHGYLENIDIWDDFVGGLEQHFSVLRVDMPGHGKSVCKLQTIGMEFMADCVSAVISSLALKKVFLVGHSMGGYVSLAFAERYPTRVSGLCLLHSTPDPDSAEKRKGRLDDIELVKANGKEKIVDTNIPRLFAKQNLDRFAAAVNRSKKIALSTPDLGIIGALNGMAQRPDRNHVVAAASFPVFFIYGRHDNLIATDVATSVAERHKKARTIFLDNSGHLGFIEEKDQTTAAIISILTQVFS